MPGGFSGLAGLSGVYPGMLETQKVEDQNELTQLQLGGMKVAGNYIKSLFQPQMQPLQPGGPPQQAQLGGPPQAPPQQVPRYNPAMISPMPSQQQPPGQPSAPAGGPPVRPPPAGGAAASTPTPGGGPMAAIQQAAQTGQLDLRTAATLIARANPNAKPRDIVAALNVAMPYLKAEEQMQVAQLRLKMQEEMERDRREDRAARLEETTRYHKAEEESKKQHEAGVMARFQKKETRLQAAQDIRQDEHLKDAQFKREKYEQATREGRMKFDRDTWLKMYNAEIAATRTAIQAYSDMNQLPDSARELMIKHMAGELAKVKDRMQQLQDMSATPAPNAPAFTPPGSGAGSTAPVPFTERFPGQ